MNPSILPRTDNASVRPTNHAPVSKQPRSHSVERWRRSASLAVCLVAGHATHCGSNPGRRPTTTTAVPRPAATASAPPVEPDTRSSGAPSSAGPPDQPTRAAIDLENARHAFVRAIGSLPSEEDESPRDATPLRTYQDAVRIYLRAVLDASVARDERDVVRIANALRDPISGTNDAAEPDVPPEGGCPSCGRIDVAGIERPPERPDWLAIRLDVRLPGCASEPALYILRNDGHWQFVLADDGLSLSGEWLPNACARRDLEISLIGVRAAAPAILELYVPEDQGGSHRPYFEFRVLRIGPDPLAPIELVRAHRGIVEFETGPWWEVTLRENGFDLGSVDESRRHIGPGSWLWTECPMVEHFVVRGERLRLVATDAPRSRCRSFGPSSE